MVNLFFVPPLKTIALNRVAIDVCCKREIFTTIQSRPSFQGNEIIDQWIANKIIDWWIARTKPTVDRIVDKLKIPASLKPEVSENVMRTGVEIHFWNFANKGSAFYHFLLDHFHFVSWSNFGEIDKKRTVEKIVEFYLQDRFNTGICRHVSPWLLLCLACYYCIEETISLLLSYIQQFNIPPDSFSEDKVMSSPITQYWLKKLEGNSPPHSHIHLYQLSVLNLNLPAIEYFFRHMSVEERDESFKFVQKVVSELPAMYRNYVPSLYPASAIVFLVSNLTIAQQYKLFQEYKTDILCFFLNSSHRMSFINVFDIFSKHLSALDLLQLLTSITSKADEVCFRYSDIFTAVFETCSTETRDILLEMILEQTDECSMLSLLVKQKNAKCIHSLLAFASSKQRSKIRKIVESLSTGRRKRKRIN